MRRILSFAAFALLLVVAASVAEAVEGNARKGKFLFRKSCRSCHGTTASDLSPMTKTQAEWIQIFAATDNIPCVKDWPALSAADKNDILAYAHEFAKDSPTPAKCE